MYYDSNPYGVLIFLFFVIVVIPCCLFGRDDSSSNNRKTTTTPKRNAGNNRTSRSYRSCPSCGAPLNGGYCEECGYPDVNLGWVGENY